MQESIQALESTNLYIIFRGSCFRLGLVMSAILTQPSPYIPQLCQSQNVPWGAFSLISLTLERPSLKNTVDKSVAARLNNLIRKTNGRAATVPQDHIYGLLRLVGQGQLPSHLRPDYTLPFEAVWLSYIAFIVSETGDLNRLSNSGRRSLHGVPTWLPDLRIPERKPDKTAFTTSHAKFSPDNQTLYAQGKMLGGIEKVFVFTAVAADNYPGAANQLHDFFSDFFFKYRRRILQMEPPLNVQLDHLARIVDSADSPCSLVFTQGIFQVLCRAAHLGSPVQGKRTAAASEDSLTDDGDDRYQARKANTISLVNGLARIGPFLRLFLGGTVIDVRGREGWQSEVGAEVPGPQDGYIDLICQLKGSNYLFRLRRKEPDS